MENQRTQAMILLLMEHLLDWLNLSKEHGNVAFFDVYADMLRTLQMANDTLTCDSVNIICRSIRERQDNN